jgi:hypothetical protein
MQNQICGQIVRKPDVPLDAFKKSTQDRPVPRTLGELFKMPSGAAAGESLRSVTVDQ